MQKDASFDGRNVSELLFWDTSVGGHSWASSFSKLAASSSSRKRKFYSASGGKNERIKAFNPLADWPNSEESAIVINKKILGSDKKSLHCSAG
jgi:hypothetical protein